MKDKIHPRYNKVVVHCGCGNTFETRSTSEEIHAETCSMCHPFYTGKQRFMDTAGRIERFQKKYGNSYMKKPADQAIQPAGQGHGEVLASGRGRGPLAEPRRVPQ
jgi:large subunit ribosomal protein L31